MNIEIKRLEVQNIPTLIDQLKQKFFQENKFDIFESELPASHFLGPPPSTLTSSQVLDRSLFLVANDREACLGEFLCQSGKYHASMHVSTIYYYIKNGTSRLEVLSGLLNRALVWIKENDSITRLQVQIPVQKTKDIEIFKSFGFAVEGETHETSFDDEDLTDSKLLALLL